MPYLPLSRKYRPQTFDEVVFQDFVVNTLKNSIELGRVSHSYLFTGPRGVGKTSLARIFAKALNCNSPENVNPCNKCENCIEITNGTSMDVVEIDGASNRGIDEIRQLRENVRFVSVKCKYKVYIIDEVHMLTDAAFNALLKTLEEPPEYVIFIFATTDVHKIPATILSRCQRFDFTKIPFKFMLNYLKELLKKENILYENDALNIVIRNSEGCMRDALSLIDQLIAFSNNKITLNDTLFLLGMSDKATVDNLFINIINEDAKSIEMHIEEIDKKGYNFTYILKTLIEYTRTLLFGLVSNGKFPEHLTDNEKIYFKSLLDKATEQKLFAIFQILQKTISDLKYFSFSKYIFEFGIYKACRVSDIIPSDIQHAFKIDKPKQTVKKSGEKVSLSVEEAWSSFLNEIAKTKPNLSANLAHGYISSYSNGIITIGFSSDKRFHYEISSKKENISFLKGSIAKFFTDFKDINIIVENDSKKKALIEKRYEAESFYKRKVKQEAEEDEVVKDILKEFDGEIESIKPLKK
jgi:DNA polymerase-3 subunit gamma/tau